MVNFVKTTAWPKIVEINTEHLARNPIDGKDMYPLWLATSAAIVVNSSEGMCVLLVKRKGDTIHSGKWALIPAGGTDCKEELLKPSLAVKRELNEELKLCYKGEKICKPCNHVQPLPITCVKIVDIATGEKTKERGEIIPAQGQFIFMQAFLLGFPLEELKIKDGEEDEFGNLLDREIVAVRICDDLHGKVVPVEKFRLGKRSPVPCTIDLSGYQTPTLNWFRQYHKREEVRTFLACATRARPSSRERKHLKA